MSDLDFKNLDYSRLRESFSTVHSKFKKYFSSEEDEDVRSLDDASIVLGVLEKIAPKMQQFIGENKNFLALFRKAWGDYKNFNDLDYVYNLCFVEKFLFPDTQIFLIERELGEVERSFDEWIKDTLRKHEVSQKKIRENFEDDLADTRVLCHCSQCSDDFQTFYRDHAFSRIKIDIDYSIEKLVGLSENDARSLFIDVYNKISKKINRRLGKAKQRLRKGVYYRLEDEVDSLMKKNFSYGSELLSVYRQKLDLIILDELKRKGLRQDIVLPIQRERFFSQLGRGIWKESQMISREIDRLIQTSLSFKRKDVSARILQEYLGQFWIYSDARKIKRKIIYHMGPTNSGKTYHAIKRLSGVTTGCYLAPLRLLATELYDTLNEMGVCTTLLTGEEVINVEKATHFSSTIEMAKIHDNFDMCVIDEIQMINDPQRGWAWTRAFVSFQAPEVHLCGDGTALDVVKRICELCGDELEVKEYKRMTDLKVLPYKIKADELQKHDAVIVFSRRNALRYKIDLERLDYKVSIIYGRLSPEVRREQAKKFDKGETDIIVSTDAISMGMNLPIKRVIFTTLSKFINSKEIPITNSEIKQISGRAGRFKRFPTGFVSCLEKVEDGIERIEYAISEGIPQKKFAMVGPDLDIFAKVNKALEVSSLPELELSEFLKLFNTMQFDAPFFCVDLKEMIEVTEMVERANRKKKSLTNAEMFGFSCAPVNLGLPEHVDYFLSIVNSFINGLPIHYQKINYESDNIDYLETSIKCVELYQWLARHFNKKNFDYDEMEILHNKGKAVDKLNSLLSEKIVLGCAVCGCKLPSEHKHNICEDCFKKRIFQRKRLKISKKGALMGNRKITGRSRAKVKGESFSRTGGGRSIRKKNK